MKREWLRSAKRKPTKKTEELKACGALGEECSFSVWAEQKVKDTGQPRSCWRLVK